MLFVGKYVHCFSLQRVFAPEPIGRYEMKTQRLEASKGKPGRLLIVYFLIHPSLGNKKHFRKELRICVALSCNKVILEVVSGSQTLCVYTLCNVLGVGNNSAILYTSVKAPCYLGYLNPCYPNNRAYQNGAGVCSRKKNSRK